MIRRNTWIVLGVFVVLLGVTTYLQITGKLKASGSQSTPVPTEPSVFKIDTGQITGLTIQKSTGESLKAQMGNDGIWTVVEPKGATTPDQIASAVGALQGWTIISELNPVPPLGSMGLSSPRDTIILTNKDGQERKIAVGNQTPSGSGYYVQVDGGTPLIVSMSNVSNVLQAFPPTATPTSTATPGQGETAPPTTPIPSGTETPASTPAPANTP